MDAVELAYDEAGTGPALVLIHGHPFNRSMWAPQLAVLTGSYRVIAPDLRGYGDSPVTPGTVPMSQLATDPRGAAAALRGRAQRPDYRPLLRGLDVPALVLTGDQDGYSTAEITDRLTGCLRQPRRITLTGVGHLPNLEDQARFNAELTAFLAPAAAAARSE